MKAHATGRFVSVVRALALTASSTGCSSVVAGFEDVTVRGDVVAENTGDSAPSTDASPDAPPLSCPAAPPAMVSICGPNVITDVPCTAGMMCQYASAPGPIQCFCAERAGGTRTFTCSSLCVEGPLPPPELNEAIVLANSSSSDGSSMQEIA